MNFLVKNGGSFEETGLGIDGSLDNEIVPGLAIQLDLTNLAKAGVTSGTLTATCASRGKNLIY